jgi:F-type H+-transporting ATPase subunit b
MTIQPRSLRNWFLIAALAVCVLPRLHAQQKDANTAPITQQDPVAEERDAKHDLHQSIKEDSGESEHDQMRHSDTVKMMGRVLHLQPEQAAKTFEFINFLILVVAIGWALAKSLPKTFANRTSGIAKNLVEARTATESANIRLAQVEQRLSRLDSEIAAIRTQSEADAAHDEQRIKAAAEEDKLKVIAAAEQEILAATAHAQREIRRFAAEMVIEQATQRLQISADLDRQLIEEFAGKLTASSGDKRSEN